MTPPNGRPPGRRHTLLRATAPAPSRPPPAEHPFDLLRPRNIYAIVLMTAVVFLTVTAGGWLTPSSGPSGVAPTGTPAVRRPPVRRPRRQRRQRRLPHRSPQRHQPSAPPPPRRTPPLACTPGDVSRVARRSDTNPIRARRHCDPGAVPHIARHCDACAVSHAARHTHVDTVGDPCAHPDRRAARRGLSEGRHGRQQGERRGICQVGQVEEDTDPREGPGKGLCRRRPGVHPRRAEDPVVRRLQGPRSPRAHAGQSPLCLLRLGDGIDDVGRLQRELERSRHGQPSGVRGIERASHRARPAARLAAWSLSERRATGSAATTSGPRRAPSRRCRLTRAAGYPTMQVGIRQRRIAAPSRSGASPLPNSRPAPTGPPTAGRYPSPRSHDDRRAWRDRLPGLQVRLS